MQAFLAVKNWLDCLCQNICSSALLYMACYSGVT